MTLGTNLFWAISRSLADHRVSTPVYQTAASNRADYFGSSADTCRLATCMHSLQCSSDEHLSNLISRFEAQVSLLEALAPHFSTCMAGKESRTPKNDTSQADVEVITALSVFLVGCVKVIGLVLLNDALDRISQRHSARALALGIIGANIAVFWAISGFAMPMANGGEVMWDHVTLLCLLGLDVGCILGGFIAFGKTAG